MGENPPQPLELMQKIHFLFLLLCLKLDLIISAHLQGNSNHMTHKTQPLILRKASVNIPTAFTLHIISIQRPLPRKKRRLAPILL